MKYLVDTDVLIDHIRGKKYIDLRILKQGLGMSIISFGELLYGAYKSSDVGRSLEKIDNLLNQGVTVETLSAEIMHVYAQLKVKLEKSGQKLDEFDLLIATTAQVKGTVFLTRNVKHFKRIKDLKLHA